MVAQRLRNGSKSDGRVYMADDLLAKKGFVVMDMITYTVAYSKESGAINDLLVQRGVEHLCHFTTFENLCSMVEMGELVSRKTLENYEIQADFQDDLRFEGPHFINLSIQRPNSFLWDKFAKNCPQKEWCLLMLNPGICQYEGVLFTTANATASNVRYKGTNPGLAGLEALFANIVINTRGYTIRSSETPYNCPTSIQAEVLCPEPIDWEDVHEVLVFSEADKARLVKMSGLSEKMVKVCPTVFPDAIRAKVNQSYVAA